MAHGWDSFFPSLPPVTSDPSTSRTLETEGNLSQQIENFIGHHDFSGMVASHEAPATNCYPNPSIGNSSSDCVYQRYCKETPWQDDGEPNSDFAADGLTSESFPSSFPTDLQGLKQDCGILATSFLEDYSDVSSCSDADVGEPRPSCKFMGSGSFPKPKTDGIMKYSSSEWIYTNAGNISFPTESLHPNMSETNVKLPSPSNVKARENIVECAHVKNESSENSSDQSSVSSNMVTTTGSETAKENVERKYSDISKAMSGPEHLAGDGTEYSDSNVKEQIIAAALNPMITFDNEQGYVDEKVLRKNMKESFDQGNEEFDHPCPADGQNRNEDKDKDKDKRIKNEVIKGVRKESRSSEKDIFDEQKSSNPKSTDVQDENIETSCQGKEIQSNISQSSDPQTVKVTNCKDATFEVRESTLESKRDDVESCLQLSEHQSNESVGQGNVSLSNTMMRDGLVSDGSDKNEQILANNSECSTDVSFFSGQGFTSAAENTGTCSPYPDCNGPSVSIDSLSIDDSDNKQGVVHHVESCLHSAVIDPCLEKEKCRPENKNACCAPPVTIDDKELHVSSLESCLQSDTSSTDVKLCLEKEWTSPAENRNETSSDQQQSLHQSPLAQEPEGLCGDVSENARESFVEDTPTEELSVLGMLYGEPLSREDSSCETDDSKLDTSQCKDTSVARIDSMSYAEGQAPHLISSIQLQKHLQPVVVLKTLESSGTNDSYHCTGCQHSTHSVDHLIEHHHCCHSVYNFQFCKTCNLYLMTNEQAEKHLCGMTKEDSELTSDSSMQKKRKRQGRHKCSRCGLIFSKIFQYIKHMRTHTGKTPFKCNECGLYFAQGCTLRRHKRIPGRCKPPKPPVRNSDAVISDTTVPPQEDLIEKKLYAKPLKCYVKLVDISKTNLCRKCSKGFTTAERAKKHFNDVHKGESLTVSTSQSTTKLSGEKSPKVETDLKGKYECPLCPRLFKYSYNRARHLRDCVRDSVYGGKEKVGGKFRCPLCLATFTLSANRYRHIKKRCLRECLNRLAKERAKSSQKVGQRKVTEQKVPSKEIEQKMLSKENEQKKQAPPALPVLKTVPRYKCNLCPAVFCHASGKYRHMKKHELFKLTGKKFRYKNSVFSTLSKPATLSSTKTEESKTDLKSADGNTGSVLTCHFCGKCYSTSQSLKKHEHTHRGERPYRCLECGKGFKKRAYLIGHKMVHQRRIQCTVCRKILPTVGELIQHRKSHLKKGMLQCPDCHLQFQYPAHLLRHLDSHKNRESKAPQLEERPPLKSQQSLEAVKEQSGPNQLQCSLCREVFNDSQVLRKHCLTHISGSSSNQCPFCKHNFSTRRYLLRHMIKHTGDKPLSCTNCGKQFYRDLYLKLHSAKCLLAQNKCLYTKIKGSYQCSFCPRLFFKKNRLINHHRAHSTNSLLLCTRCGQYFGFRKLNQHQKNCSGTALNTGISSPNGDCNKSTSQTTQNVCKIPLQSNATKMLPFKCSHCTQRFRYRSLLLRHLVSHTGLQPYACIHCGHRYGSRTACLQHEAFCDGVYKDGQSKVKIDPAAKLSNMPVLRETTQKSQAEGEAEYKCKFCTKTFMKSRNLRRHILTHNEVKPYRCKACDSCFSRYDHLKVHQTRCRGRKTRLEVCIPKISLDDVGKGWQRLAKFSTEPAEKQEAFECEVCSRSFPTQSKLSRHCTMFHITKLFKCTGCGSSFAHEKSLKKHKKMRRCRKVSREKNASMGVNPPMKNVIKPLDGVRKRALQRIQPHFNKKCKYVCSYCPRAFGNTWQLGVHTRLHTGEKPYCCDYCGERFIRKDYVQRHFPKCTKKPEQNEVLCDKCGGFFPEVQIEKHKKSCSPSSSKSTVGQCKQSTSQSPPKGFSCAYCSSRFLLFSQLQEHFLNAHKMETMVPPVSTAPLQHHLSNIPNIKEEPLDESCDERLSNGANLICKPDTSLDGEVSRSFFCPECNMSFISKAGLIGHQRVHAVEHPFNCKTCKKGFWNKNLLRNHYRKCRFGYIAERNPRKQMEVPLKAEIDFALNDAVLVFKEGSETTGTGVLQTNFSCKENVTDGSPQNPEENQEQGNSSKEKKAIQYQCSECDKSFTDGLMLISHLEDHGREEQEKKRNTCTRCGRVCTSQGHLEKHMRIHGINKTFSCPDCSKVVNTLSELEIHRTVHDQNRPFPCKLCNQRFWTRPSLCNHYGKDHPDDAFSCRFCNKAYSVKKSLARHIKKWHQKEQKVQGNTVQEKSITEQQSSSQVSTTGESGEDENNGSEDSDSDSAPYFPCHVCGKTFSTSESLEDHQRCHLGEKPHECSECGKCFFQASQLQQHQRMHKSEFQCQACGRGFVSLFALRKHKHTHGKSRPYRCSKCHLSFTGPSQLAEHMYTHREENFPCDICNRVFQSKTSRAEHRKSHSKSGEHFPPSNSSERYITSASLSTSSSVFNKELKYRCGVCSERFKDPEELSEHGCMAAKERPYSCSDCDKHFLHASHLKKHRTTHQLSWSIGEYTCNECNNSFASSQDFLSHLKHHADTLKHKGDPSHCFICPVCHQCFDSATELMCHFPMHPDGAFECKTCKLTFSSGSKLKEHERCHLTTSTELECTECGQSFFGSDTFRQHHCSHQHTIMESEHSNPSAKTSSSTSQQAAGDEEEIDVTGEDLYHCPLCSMQFSSKSGLLEHQNKQHPNEKPFKCEFCGKTFPLRRYLKKHERRHFLKSAPQNTAQSTAIKFQCTRCGSEFNTAQDLSLHMRLHAEKEVGEYRCDMCYRSFSHWSLLKQHQESHVGEVVYECTECDKAFAFPHLLEEHQQTHARSSL